MPGFGNTTSAPPVDARVSAAREVNARMLVVKAGLLIAFLVVGLRLIQVQVIESRRYKELARKQNESKQILPAERGRILDRNGRTLASNSTLVSFGADPTIVEDERGIAKRFADVFGKGRDYYLGLLRKENTRFVYLERRVSPRLEQQVRAREFEGVLAKNEPQRLYNYGRAAGQLLGFTSIDNRGLDGLELQLDSLLRGRDGYVIMQKDALRRQRPSVDYPGVPPVNGNSAVLTIDIDVQTIAEAELRQGVEKNKAQAGLVVMLDPVTGEVLAMANSPSVDPGDPASVSRSAARNRVITDVYEPGSVFKVVTAAAAIEQNVVTPETKFNAEHGSYSIFLPSGKFRNTVTDMHAHGIITFQEAMEVSSNIVMAKASDLIGAEGMFTTARRFGFGEETGIELPGEVRGDLKKPAEWSGTTLNTMSYGYEIGATPLQIAAAYAAVANRGTLMKPFVVRQILDAEGTVIAETTPQALRKVVSKATAETLVRMLRGVIEHGTGVRASVRGVAVAGKTGTARKYANGRYEEGSYIASFVGFFPAEEPAVVCLVMLDIPGAATYAGGLVSAPIFKAIAEKIYATSPRFKRPLPTVMKGPVAVPDVTTLKIEAGEGILTAHGFTVRTEKSGPVIVRQVPPAGVKLAPGSTVVLIRNDAAAVPNGFTVVPDVRGLTMRRAMNRLTMQHLEVAIAGSGNVTSQAPLPGDQVRIGTRVGIRCDPRNLSQVMPY